MTPEKDEMDAIIDRHPFRKMIFDRVPFESNRILDFGCNQGELLLRLQRDKSCRELYGVEVNENVRETLEKFLDGSWILDLGNEDADLGTEYRNFFNYIIIHDALEHLYDPWYVLPKLGGYLAPEGKILIAVPNFRYWSLWSQVVMGDFEYGSPGGLMNEDHVRWFTLKSLRELVAMSGLAEISYDFQFPYGVNLNLLKDRLQAPISTLKIPPPEISDSETFMTVQFPGHVDIRSDYMEFLANKIIMVCGHGRKREEPRPIQTGSLGRRRSRLSPG